MEISNPEQFISEDINSENENYIIKPSVAPATPHVFASPHPPSSSNVEIALKASQLVKSGDVEPSSISTSILMSSSIVTSAIVVEEKKQTVSDENNVKKEESIVVLQKDLNIKNNDIHSNKDGETSPKDNVVTGHGNENNLQHNKNHEQPKDGIVAQKDSQHKEEEGSKQKQKENLSSVNVVNSNIPPKETERYKDKFKCFTFLNLNKIFGKPIMLFNYINYV